MRSASVKSTGPQFNQTCTRHTTTQNPHQHWSQAAQFHADTLRQQLRHREPTACPLCPSSSLPLPNHPTNSKPRRLYQETAVASRWQHMLHNPPQGHHSGYDNCITVPAVQSAHHMALTWQATKVGQPAASCRYTTLIARRQTHCSNLARTRHICLACNPDNSIRKTYVHAATRPCLLRATQL